MIKFVLLFPRKKGLSRDEFMRQWRDVCVPMVRELPGLRGLVISPVIEQLSAEEPQYDGIAEWWFDDLEAGKAALESPQAKAVIDDMPNFVDMDNFILTMTEEITLIEQAGSPQVA
ncbi:MAG: EthD family reductase [Gammaproteobacteria bacterium]